MYVQRHALSKTSKLQFQHCKIIWKFKTFQQSWMRNSAFLLHNFSNHRTFWFAKVNPMLNSKLTLGTHFLWLSGCPFQSFSPAWFQFAGFKHDTTVRVKRMVEHSNMKMSFIRKKSQKMGAALIPLTNNASQYNN